MLRSFSAGVEMTKPKKDPLRPPGAVEDSLFTALCNLCGKCWEACPYGAIKQTGKGYSAPGFPVIIPEEGPCHLCDSPACSQVCDEGALKPVEKEKIKLGVAIVNTGTCLAYSKTIPDCDYCYDRCPLKDKAIFYNSGPVIKKECCAGCGICEYYCISNPKAVKVSPI